MNDRVILHSDANCFYASVEMLLNPELQDKAIAVCGSEDDRHGIVLAKSEKAKRMGVKLDIIQKSGSWFSLGEVRMGQGRDAAKQYLVDHPDQCDAVEQEIRKNFHKLMSNQSKVAARAAGRAVDVSADDFDDAD